MSIDEQAYPLCTDFSQGYTNLAVPLQVIYTGYYNSKSTNYRAERTLQSWYLQLINYRQNPGSDPAALEVGQFVLRRPNHKYALLLPKGEQVGYYWIYFTGNYVETLLESGHLKPDQVYTLSEAGIQTLRQDFNMLFRECTQKKSGYEHICASSLMTILVHLSRGCQIGSGAQNDNVYRRLEKSLLYAQSHFSDSTLTPATLAQRTQLSISRYRELFREHVGMPPSEYIIKLRIDHACSLLQNTALTVSQIASFCGYLDMAYFSRLFRKKTGLSPTEYRQQQTEP